MIELCAPDWMAAMRLAISTWAMSGAELCTSSNIEIVVLLA
jgi:hypothetical protein